MSRLVLLAVLALAGCKREARELRLDPPIIAALDDARPEPGRIGGAPPPVLRAMDNPERDNAYQLAQGKRLYAWFNCRDCHAQGGGAAGPSFTEGWWRYGPDRVSVFLSIRDGRPHGMPAFGTHITPEQVWQLTGYVRTLGAFSATLAAPSRNDELYARPAENRAPAATPIGRPPSRSDGP